LLSDALQNELITTILGWLKALYDAGYPLCTSMFPGINSDTRFSRGPATQKISAPDELGGKAITSLWQQLGSRR